MEAKARAESENRHLVSRLFQRLELDAPGYVWDNTNPPFHSSYDNWHVWGYKRQSSGSRKPSTAKSENAISQEKDTAGSSQRKDSSTDDEQFKLAQILSKEAGSNAQLFIKVLDFIRLPPRQHGDPTLVVMVAESPGRNYLIDMVELGPNFYPASSPDLSGILSPTSEAPPKPIRQKLPLGTFLQFAIGASTCCEFLHHGNELVHGELRGDAFHFNKQTGVVKLINFGSGARSFENGLTSAGWSTLTAQLGVEHKLQFIAPEQTGRLPAEPDSRTDIYSLGVLFWTMLADEPPFAGSKPLEIMQNVLSKRIAPIYTKRPDVPDVISRIVQKMTQKNMDDRYQSASGLKYDLQQCQKMLENGDGAALEAFKIGTKDVSSSFTYPSQLIGREKQVEAIANVVDKAAARAAMRSPISKQGLYSLRTASSLSSGERPDNTILEDAISDDNSSTDRDGASRVQSTSEPNTAELLRRQHDRPSQETLDAIDMVEHRSSVDSRGSIASLDPVRNMSFDITSRSNSTSTETARSAVQSQLGSSGSLLRTAQKLRKVGKTEVITIQGAAGLGKSRLLQTVQVKARSHGYYASAKFDQVKKVPYEPVFRVTSSIFRQMFAESDVNTEFHSNIRALVRPVWGSLHKVLELPPWLLSQQMDAEGPIAQPHQACGEKGNMAADWVQGGGVVRDRRFISTFLDILRLLALQKFLCLCLDDLQFADEESLELIQTLIASNIPVILILTFRSRDTLAPKALAAIANATDVELPPLTEEQTSEYVAATLHRTQEYVLPLVAVIQQRTGGSPFFIREVLDQCHRRKCIYYSWRNSQWEFDLDKIFAEFSAPSGMQLSSADQVLRRLQDLPSGASSFLAWASLVGSSFTFSLVHFVTTCDCSHNSPPELLPKRLDDPVVALQTALSSYAIMGTDDEDQFRFSHDRYMSAAFSLAEQHSLDEMHYVMASAMMKHYTWTEDQATQMLYDQSRHVCEAIQVIKKRASSRKPFRQLLYRAAQTAREQGARQMSLTYLQHALQLLAEDRWDTSDRVADVQYDEVITLMVQTAGATWYLGDFKGATALIKDIFEHAKDAVDRVPAYIIESRMNAQRGDTRAAFGSMKRALSDLGHDFEPKTWEECDAEFERIVPLLKYHELDLDGVVDASLDKKLMTTGSVLIELISAAFWSDALLFYQITMHMLQMVLDHGIFPQAALGYIHLASIAISRFDMLECGLEMGHIAKRIVARFPNESYTNGRCLTLHALFLGHLETSMSEQLPVLQAGLDNTIAAGDKILHTLNVGVTAAYRTWSCHEMSDIETYVSDQEEHLPNWEKDLRGGSILTAVRQYVRAMQGKTNWREALTVLDDDEHQSSAYHAMVHRTSSDPERPLTIYNCYRLTALYRFGHIDEAIALGEELLGPVSALWCMRYNYVTMFYLAMALMERTRNSTDTSDREVYVVRIRDFEAKIRSVRLVNNANFGSWLHLIDAELAELDKNYERAMQSYEAALSHCEVHANTMEAALSNELYAEFLIRRGSGRPAKALIHDAIAGYQRAGAFGKAQHVTDKHAFTLLGTKSLSQQDACTQTVDDGTADTHYKLHKGHDDLASQTSDERTKAWLAPQVHDNHVAHDKDEEQPTFSASGLDMIDLANILESSQLLSSELDEDKLLASLTQIIVDSTNADYGGVVVNDEEIGWTVAAVHGSVGINIKAEELVGVPLDKLENAMARQLTLYVLRFRENLLLPNVVEDERFAIPSKFREEHPEGRAMIVLPILHGDNAILGAIYIEGPPRSFTERNTAVLTMLVNQISISIANAMLFKRLAKASASNAAMLDVQKQALAKAREAERKAKEAQSHAMEQVRLKEEAAKVKSMFLANVSHELRTPLNGVIGMSELLKASKLTKEQEGYADSVRVCADTLLSVINDILDFSKLEAGKMQMFNVQLSLNETISEVVRALSYTNLERGLQTIEQLELDPKMLVMGDPVRLHQVFMNLLSNAYKFTAKGKVTVRATLEHETETMIQVKCSVTDTGIGISEEQRRKLFLPFSQADGSTARNYGGTGLGLSICKAIVEIMKGTIWLESEVGVGTTVAFTMPFQKVGKSVPAEPNGNGVRAADPMAMFTTTQAADAAATHNSVAGIPRDQLRVCIAEDNPINQKIAISFVQKLGFKCAAFNDGQQAVDALAKASAEGDPFHLVLMDVQMPVLDGYNATREIRKHPDPAVNGVLVIAMTASAIRGDKEKCLEAGMNNYLAKPVRAHVLKQMLEGYLNQSTKSIPNLQQQANAMAKEAMDQATDEGGNSAGREKSLPDRTEAS
ncbi:hypothetical protein MBLNU457_7310t2 [Dothideomycetes sp. NU457]